MPTYGYECKACKHSFDVFQSMKDDPMKICPECGKELRRLINGGNGIIFKGNGFYITDKNGKSTIGTGDTAKSTESKSDVKSADTGTTSTSGKNSDTPTCSKAAG
ncbi:MAG: zinc ribbon domain-containing protein [Treponema sp.]|nr:zinc ribbon domain-containing protein [Treponema sp.]